MGQTVPEADREVRKQPLALMKSTVVPAFPVELGDNKINQASELFQLSQVGPDDNSPSRNHTIEQMEPFGQAPLASLDLLKSINKILEDDRDEPSLDLDSESPSKASLDQEESAFQLVEDEMLASPSPSKTLDHDASGLQLAHEESAFQLVEDEM